MHVFRNTKFSFLFQSVGLGQDKLIDLLVCNLFIFYVSLERCMEVIMGIEARKVSIHSLRGWRHHLLLALPFYFRICVCLCLFSFPTWLVTPSMIWMARFTASSRSTAKVALTSNSWTWQLPERRRSPSLATDISRLQPVGWLVGCVDVPKVWCQGRRSLFSARRDFYRVIKKIPVRL